MEFLKIIRESDDSISHESNIDVACLLVDFLTKNTQIRSDLEYFLKEHDESSGLRKLPEDECSRIYEVTEDNVAEIVAMIEDPLSNYNRKLQLNE